MYILNEFDVSDFLAKYWQKQPVVIKNAFENFVDPLDEHELAGLAQEPDVDARIVSQHLGKWELHQGPFDDFDEVCQHAWSLLVQNVNGYIEEADQLISAFDFIPQWRIEDLMVSFSVKDAGVGPHLDQYDVFIIQGKGQRHWKVGPRGNHLEKSPHPRLRQVEPFSTVIDEMLQPGDMIYIPPGFPHDGVALEDCLNYSVGFRAPNQNELLSAFADYAIDHGVLSERYSDTDLTSRTNPLEIKKKEIADFRGLMTKMLDSNDFEHWLCSFLSHSQVPDEAFQTPEVSFVPSDVEQMFQQNTNFIKVLGVKSVIPEFNPENQTEVTVFVHEIPFNVPIQDMGLVEKVLNQPCWQAKSTTNSENSIFFVQFMTTLLNTGLWYPE